MTSARHTIGNYEVVRLLGAGGMGEVFLARHRILGRLSAVKVLRSEITAHPEFTARFLNEARAIAAIEHPGVVQIFDCDVLEDGRAYIAMEYLHGLNLRDTLALEPPLRQDIARCSALIGELALGLHAAHIREIIHRDIKPENMFLVRRVEDVHRLQAKVLDFGIAKLLSSGPLAQQTASGQLLGTPQYMSPEQCRGERTMDRRSDIYSLGCVAFEVFTGRPVFEADSVPELLFLHTTTPAPAIATVGVQLPSDLASLIDQMLAKDPSQRPTSMRRVAEAIAAQLGVALDGFASLMQAPPRFPQQELHRVTLAEAAPRDPKIQRQNATTAGGAFGRDETRMPGSTTMWNLSWVAWVLFAVLLSSIVLSLRGSHTTQRISSPPQARAKSSAEPLVKVAPPKAHKAIPTERRKPDRDAAAQPTLPPRKTWRAFANPMRSEEHAQPQNAIDDDVNTRYTTGRPMLGNEWLLIDFGRPVSFTGILLDQGRDYGREITVYTTDSAEPPSTNLTSWGQALGRPIHPPARERRLASIRVATAFPRTVSRYLVIIQTGKDANAWWSVREVNFLGLRAWSE